MPDPTKRKVRMLYAPWNFEQDRLTNTVVRQLGVVELPKKMADAAIREGAAEPYPKPARATRSSSASSSKSED